MSYEVIARKWRPQTFNEVCGQDHVTTPLRNAVRTGRVPHSILLTGPRGTGKTTLARILARCLNCEKGPTETPCGTCVECREISAGRSTDVQEIDAASRTGVDDARAIGEAIRYSAAPGKHRIFVIDEVHMLSTQAFNALLKTLEEPPPNSLFVFATTNPEKIPATVLSRCQRYDLRRIPIAKVVANLRGISEAEGITVSDTSLRLIAREGDGSMRDAQTLFDQVLSYGGSDVLDETVTDVLDLTDRRVLTDILKACIEGDPAAGLEACGRANTGGSEASRLGKELVQLLRDLVVLRLAPEADNLVEGSDEELADLRALAQSCDPARLRRMFRALVKEQEDLAWAPQPFAVLEMAVVRLASMPAGDDVTGLLARLDALENRLRSGGPSGGASGSETSGGPPRAPGLKTAASSSSPTRGKNLKSDAADAAMASGDGNDTASGPPSASPSSAAATEQPSQSPPATASPSRALDRSDYLKPQVSAAPPSPAVERAVENEPVGSENSQSSASSQPENSTTANLSAPPTGAPLPVVFDRLRGLAQEANRGGFACLEGGQLLERSEHSLRIALLSPFHTKRLQDRAEEFGRICENFFGHTMRLEIEVIGEAAGGDATRSGNAATRSRAGRRDEERRQRHEALNHPAVNLALEELKGHIVEIRPLGGGSR